MIEQWQELKETITEMRDNDGTGTQQDVCKFLVDYMETLEKQMQQPCEDAVSRTLVHEAITASIAESENPYEMWQRIEALPSVTPQTVTDFADKCRECGKIQNELTENAVSREAVLNGLANIAKAKAKSDAQKALMGRVMFFTEQLPSVTPRTNLARTSQDCISRQAVIILIDEASEMHPYKVIGDSDTYSNYNQGWSDACDWLYANIEGVPSVKPKYTDEEIDRAQAVEQAYVDKMVELAVEKSRREWLNSFDTSSATKCFEAVNLLKQRLEGEE